MVGENMLETLLKQRGELVSKISEVKGFRKSIIIGTEVSKIDGLLELILKKEM